MFKKKYAYFVCIMSGIYIKDIESELFINIRPEQFAAYILGLNCPTGWLRFKIKKRQKPAANGLNFELELIEYKQRKRTKGSE